MMKDRLMKRTEVMQKEMVTKRTGTVAKPGFEGWYYKQQANGETLSLIVGKATDTAFIQVLTSEESFTIPFSLSEYRKSKGSKKSEEGKKRGEGRGSETVRVGKNVFSSDGIKLDIKRNNITLSGELEFADLTPIKGDIMGPFRFVPMECSHGVTSMRHDVKGRITLNGKEMNFNKGVGYIETDRGYSFPESYTWIHCNNFTESPSNKFDERCSIMVSIAKIPFAGFHFTGCICVVWLNGKEHRLATYKGVKILRYEHGAIELKQGKYHLTVTVDQQAAHSLASPKSGMMSGVIRESASCPAKFVFSCDDKVIFKGESRCASYEYVI